MFIKTWDETAPAGGRDLSLGDDDIRDFKYAIRERLAEDHNFFSNEAGQSNIGKHIKATLLEQGSDPSAVADALILFAKLVGSYSELHGRHENAGVQQLTRLGKLWIEALGIESEALGDIIVRGASVFGRVAGNTTTTRKFLRQTGDGAVSALPAWDTLLVADIVDYAAPVFESQLLHVRDEKSAGTHGGDFTTGAWRTRTLNTEKTNEISGASLSSNQITLPAGTYYIEGHAPAAYCNGHQAKLRNVSDNSDTIIGSSEYINAAATNTTRSIISGRFTIAAEKVFEIQHACASSASTYGFGNAANLGVTEVYTDVKIWKVA